jgi:hypothetical protein
MASGRELQAAYERLPRRELQAAAKANGIKANGKSATIIAALKELAERACRVAQDVVSATIAEPPAVDACTRKAGCPCDMCASAAVPVPVETGGAAQRADVVGTATDPCSRRAGCACALCAGAVCAGAVCAGAVCAGAVCADATPDIAVAPTVFTVIATPAVGVPAAPPTAAAAATCTRKLGCACPLCGQSKQTATVQRRAALDAAMKEAAAVAASAKSAAKAKTAMAAPPAPPVARAKKPRLLALAESSELAVAAAVSPVAAWAATALPQLRALRTVESWGARCETLATLNETLATLASALAATPPPPLTADTPDGAALHALRTCAAVLRERAEVEVNERALCAALMLLEALVRLAGPSVGLAGGRAMFAALMGRCTKAHGKPSQRHAFAALASLHRHCLAPSLGGLGAVQAQLTSALASAPGKKALHRGAQAAALEWVVDATAYEAERRECRQRQQQQQQQQQQRSTPRERWFTGGGTDPEHLLQRLAGVFVAACVSSGGELRLQKVGIAGLAQLLQLAGRAALEEPLRALMRQGPRGTHEKVLALATLQDENEQPTPAAAKPNCGGTERTAHSITKPTIAMTSQAPKSKIPRPSLTPRAFG